MRRVNTDGEGYTVPPGIMTKPIVSVAAVMMIERGDMKLHDPVSLWCPNSKTSGRDAEDRQDGKEIVEE